MPVKRKRYGKRMNSMELSEFCRQIGVMTGSGITLSRAMKLLQAGTDSRRLKAVYGELEKQMMEGVLLSDAMEATGLFPEMTVNMFRAGEASGKMQETTVKLAVHYVKEHRMNSRIKAALLYPEIVSLTALMAVLMIFLVVIPTIEPLMAGMDLPVITRLLMAFSDFLEESWYLVLAAAAAVFGFWKLLNRDRRFCYYRDKGILRIPFVGKQLRTIYTARFARSHSSLYSSGLPMLESLKIAGSTLGNRYLLSQFPGIIYKVQNGEMLSEAMKRIDGFDKKLASIIFVGEETGKLDVMLESAAENYEYESDAALSRLIGLIEPAMIIFLGAVIGLIMLGIMVPLWSMYGYVG